MPKGKGIISISSGSKKSPEVSKCLALFYQNLLGKKNQSNSYILMKKTVLGQKTL